MTAKDTDMTTMKVKKFSIVNNVMKIIIGMKFRMKIRMIADNMTKLTIMITTKIATCT